MSRKIKIKKLTDDDKNKLLDDLEISIESKYGQPKNIYPISQDEKYCYLPFSYGINYSTSRGLKSIDSKMNNYFFDGKLRSEQLEVREEAIKDLNKRGSTLISCYPGFGKTATSIYLATKIKLKTLVISHRIVLISQWKKSIEKFAPRSKIQIIKPREDLDPRADFYIINALNVPKKPRNFYKNMLTVIVDECHLIMAEGLSKSLQHLLPRYLIGLSATPYREDGLNILLDLYFGKKKIHKKLNRLHYFYKIKTQFKPVVELGSNGRVNWGRLLDSQCNDRERNEMIIYLIKFLPKNRNILVLCKRVKQGKYLVERLLEEKEDVTSLIGKEQTFDKHSRILVGTSSKAGVGFDHPRLNTLIMASDIQSYYVQYIGRIMRTREGIPLIFDIVDQNGILERHYMIRKKVYREHGGKLKHFKTEFPKFKSDII